MALVTVDRVDHVVTLTLCRPEARNALSIDLCDSIVRALEDITRDQLARTLVLRGEGSVFCAGADLAAVSGAAGIEFLPTFERMLEAVTRLRLPTIAAIHGAALGGGLQLATVCDFRIATRDSKIGIPSSTLGILVNFENIQRLVVTAGVAVAKEVLMTGRVYTGDEAARNGLITRAVEPGRLDDEVGAMASELSERAPLSVQGTKRAVQAVVDHLSGARTTQADSVAEIDRLVSIAYNSRDLQEGLAAKREKRAPSFDGI